jgi:1,4-alpha-glucan branching enzyme
LHTPALNVDKQPGTGKSAEPLPVDLRKLLAACHHDPFDVLGMHEISGKWRIRLLKPRIIEAYVLYASKRLPMQRVPETDLFEAFLDEPLEVSDYQFEAVDEAGQHHIFHDTYRFLPMLKADDAYLFNAGEHYYAYWFMGARETTQAGITGVLFVVWAPNAERVSVVGNFNDWDGRIHTMRSSGASGIWELFIPDITPGQPYKYEIRHRQDGSIHLKMDPFARETEYRPATASVIPQNACYQWSDQDWLAQRSTFDWLHQPISIYEMHLGSWQVAEDGGFLSYRQIAERLVPYIQKMGYTHVQLLPIAEFPFDGSWGYQVTGYFAPTRRFGEPKDFAFFVDYLHQHHIGVFLDWVPAHFPKDSHALAKFDGSALYEHEDPLLGEHKDWGTLIFNYGRKEVQSFLISSALFWLEEFHIDGLRVDAVASMLYLDYSREAGEWRPNEFGGNENLAAVAFIRKLNEAAHARYPGVLMMAEESTSWPGVSHPTYVGGLGFSMKWNMGWMNDTLEYMSLDPIFRQYHHDKLTFALLYAFSENFILPLSHDEVVHLKKSLLSKMPGDQWQQFANLRLLYAYMFTQPGKKLLFMGGDIGQYDEWNHQGAVQWHLLAYPYHQGIQHLVADLNRLYTSETGLYQHDFTQSGFEWINCHDSPQSVLSYRRISDHESLIVILNFTPLPRLDYCIGVDDAGFYKEILNTDAEMYGGSNVGNLGGVLADKNSWGGFSHSLRLTVPPLAAIILKRQH